MKPLTCTRAGCGLLLRSGSVNGGPPVFICANGHMLGVGDRPPVKPRPASHPEGTDLERAFATTLTAIAADLPAYVRDYEFLCDRAFKLDFAWPSHAIAVECEGIDHRKEQRYHSDIEKYNLLAAAGWKLFRCTTRMIRNDPAAFIELLRRAFGA